MKILINTGGIAATNCYVVADEVARKAVLFDAPNDTVGPLLDEVAKNRWELIGLWLTHGHFDHLADHAVVTEQFPDAKVLIHALDEPKLQNPTSSIFELPFTIPPRSADGHVTDGQRLSIGSIELEVIHTPGHAPGHVMYHFPKENVLIGGDLIIMNSVGRTDLPDSSYSDLRKSIRRVMQFPADTRLFPGHGGSSTLGYELQTNDQVQLAMES